MPGVAAVIGCGRIASDLFGESLDIGGCDARVKPAFDIVGADKGRVGDGGAAARLHFEDIGSGVPIGADAGIIDFDPGLHHAVGGEVGVLFRRDGAGCGQYTGQEQRCKEICTEVHRLRVLFDHGYAHQGYQGHNHMGLQNHTGLFLA